MLFRRIYLDGHFDTLGTAELASIEAVAMDMWKPYASSVRAHLEMIKRHQDGVAFFAHRPTSATAERLNSRIQAIRVAARGFRNCDHFKTADYFRLGGVSPCTPGPPLTRGYPWRIPEAPFVLAISPFRAVRLAGLPPGEIAV